MSFRKCALSAAFIVFLVMVSVSLPGCTGEYAMFGRAPSMPTAERFHGFNDPAMEAASRQADELTQAIARGASPASMSGPPVRWIDVRHPSAIAPPTAAPVAAVAAAPSIANTEPIYVTPAHPQDSAPVVEASVTTQVEPEPVDPTVQLLRQIRSSSDPAMVKALRAAALGVISGQRQLAPDIIEGLTPMQAEHVKQYHHLILTLSDQIAAGGEPVDTDALVERLDGMFGRQPIRISQAELCTRVDNFGVYEPFGSTTFLAGREQPMILYLELSNFHSELAEDIHEVRLEQDVVLYNESDGLAVWRVPAETIIDRSRNRRRDFFTVKMLRVPARLGVGKFQLKVRVKDLGGLTVDETSIPVRFVADQNLASLK